MPTGPTPLDKTPPGSNQHPLSSKEEARASDKEKPRVEDGGLDGVAARTAPEHVAVKQEPHIPSVSGAVPCFTWLGGRWGATLPSCQSPSSSVLLAGQQTVVEVAVHLAELAELGTAAVLAVPILVGGGVWLQTSPVCGVPRLVRFLRCSQRPPARSTLTPSSALTAQTDLHGAPHDAQPREHRERGGR